MIEIRILSDLHYETLAGEFRSDCGWLLIDNAASPNGVNFSDFGVGEFKLDFAQI